VFVANGGITTQTDADGRFALAGLADGARAIELWHPSFGTRLFDVPVRGTETTNASLSFDAPLEIARSTPPVAPAPRPSGGGGGSKCTIATNPESTIGRACAAGGIKEAKRKMKELTRAAKRNGWKGDCDTCHKDTESHFALTDGAKQEYERMVAAIPK
jgi:hypothetical protein